MSWFQTQPYGLVPGGNLLVHPDSARLRDTDVRFGGKKNRQLLGRRLGLGLLMDAEAVTAEDSAAVEAIQEVMADRRAEAAGGKNGDKKRAGAGAGAMPAEGSRPIFVEFILPFLDVPSVCLLSTTSTGWFILLHSCDVWKQLTLGLNSPPGAECGADRHGGGMSMGRTAAMGSASERDQETPLDFTLNWKTTAVRTWVKKLQGNVAKAGTSSSSVTVSSRQKRKRDTTTAAMARSSEPFVHTPFAVSVPWCDDQLFQSWLCSIIPTDFPLNKTEKLTTNVSGSASRSERWEYNSEFNTVPHIDGSKDIHRFFAEFEAPNLPVVLTNVATEWPLYKELNGNFENLAAKEHTLFSKTNNPVPGTNNHKNGSRGNYKAALEAAKGEQTKESNSNAPLYRCEASLMTIRGYMNYALQQQDERPIYLFDADYGDHMKIQDDSNSSSSSSSSASMYTVPPQFARDDYFSVLGQKGRPNHRWLIAGPQRGGSSFHVDPNYTSAWNACLTGRKRWILFPPHCTPPGVFPSEDMSHVATPVSLTEWLFNYYKAAASELSSEGYEVIVESGEIMFVPCGWWHCVINLEASVAVTQNYVSRASLTKVIKFLRGMPSSISGIDEVQLPELSEIQISETSEKGSSLLPEDEKEARENQVQLAKKKKFAAIFEAAMLQQHPEVMKPAVAALNKEVLARREKEEAGRIRQASLVLNAPSSGATVGGGTPSTGFEFSF